MARDSQQAYVVIDMSFLPDELRELVIEDASAGGRSYGITIVEQFHNGPAVNPVYGYYKSPNPDEENWQATQNEFGFSYDDLSADADAVRSKAADDAAAEAADIKAKEDAAVAAVTGDDDSKTKNKMK